MRGQHGAKAAKNHEESAEDQARSGNDYLVVGWGAGAAAGGDVGVGGLAALEVAHVLVKATLDRRVLGLEHAQVPLAWPRPHSPTPTQLDAYE